jgi:putative transcription factor
MPTCEICGKEVERTKKVKIEGIVLEACNNCAVFGEPVKEERKPEERKIIPGGYGGRGKGRSKDRAFEPEEFILFEDYRKRIRKARESMGMEQKDLARMINEKQSVISKIESGGFNPDDAVIRKIEKALKITLKEKLEDE